MRGFGQKGIHELGNNKRCCLKALSDLKATRLDKAVTWQKDLSSCFCCCFKAFVECDKNTASCLHKKTTGSSETFRVYCCQGSGQEGNKEVRCPRPRERGEPELGPRYIVCNEGWVQCGVLSSDSGSMSKKLCPRSRGERGEPELGPRYIMSAGGLLMTLTGAVCFLVIQAARQKGTMSHKDIITDVLYSTMFIKDPGDDRASSIRLLWCHLGAKWQIITYCILRKHLNLTDVTVMLTVLCSEGCLH